MIIPDISFYQNDRNTPQGVDFHMLRTQSEAVIIRVGQNNWADRDFKSNWRTSKEAGLLRGSYWFYDSRMSPELQADLCLAQFDGDFGELPFFLDLEERYKGKYRGVKNWIRFLDRVERLVPYKQVGIYTGYYYWLENTRFTGGYRSKHNDYFSRYPLWIAQYNPILTRVPRPWKSALLWQYTSSGDGAKYGVESKEIDLNLFIGNWDEWKKTNVVIPRGA